MIRMSIKCLPFIALGTLLLAGCQWSAPSMAVIDLPRSAPPQNVAAQIQAVRPQPGGQLKVRLQSSRVATEVASHFHTQQACTLDSDVTYLNFYLIDGTTSLGSVLSGLLGVVSVAHGPFSMSKKALISPGATESFVFTNVPQGTYYVAVSAHNAANTNLTASTGSGAVGNIGSLLAPIFVALSNGGGNATHPGRVEVGSGPDYPLLNGTESTLTLHLQLSSLLCL